ncbi:D-2-hydroxyacid dehydrogenase [Luteolibacter pohnpeiensis]|uniref:D-2-hydroxyacid dehydrogenase n=1 Tax=Luteolibacter pohnpeiensis TaxID=454153 RepID=A0A934SEA9_9BACT|nr:D-2-hydroxyacid dehydrogenase [Luteolibacter pohnpeiensis]MBK1884547.1 D-2-hydroxyacid dehydrogenase [Luteolibacter pohnpeiensis]
MNAPRIFCNSLLSPELFETLRAGVSPGELVLPANPGTSVLAVPQKDPAFENIDIAFGQPDLESIYECDSLRWIHVSSAGFTRYDTPEFRQYATVKGLVVTNSSTVYAEACAQQTLAFIMAHERQLPKSLTIRAASGTPAWNGLRYACGLLQNQTVLILGYGAIAARLVEMLRPFNLRVIAMRRQPKGDEGVEMITPTDLPQYLGLADHVVNILPENHESLGFFNTERFGLMKPGAAFHNIGRGTTVDQPALYDALKSRHLSAAWLDVTNPEPLPDDHPLWTLDNCYITPHIAGGYATESNALVAHFLDNYRRFVDGTPLRDQVI